MDVKRAKLKPLLESALISILEADHLIKSQQEKITNLNTTQQVLEDNSEMLTMRYLYMESSIETKHMELDQVENELEVATLELKRVDAQNLKVVEKTINNVFMLLIANYKRNQDLVRKFMDKLSSSADFEVPTPLEPLVVGALSMIDDENSPLL